MTRIVSGVAGGRRLATPSGQATRPTSDRVREAVFSALEAGLVSARSSWSGVRFLDLFAGSGAVGLEAVSRGAAHATLVEQHRRAAAVARANAHRLGLASVDVVVADARRLVARPPPGDPYGIVFADPPYSMGTDEVVDLLAALAGNGWLAAGATVALERPTRAPEPAWPSGLSAGRTRRYGETTVWYGHAT